MTLSKSDLIRDLIDRIDGATYFEVLLESRPRLLSAINLNGVQPHSYSTSDGFYCLICNLPVGNRLHW